MKVMDILYTPLDCPEMPDFDRTKLKEWLHQTYKKQTDKTRSILDDRINSTEEVVGDRYPWDLTVGFSNMEGNGPGWINNFDQEFSELSKWLFESLGVDYEDVGTVLFFPVRPEHTGFGFWHNDPDPAGMRVYLEFEMTDTNKLFMRRFKEKYEQRTVFPRPLDIAAHCEPELLEVKILHPRQCFYLNNVRAVHATYTEVPGKTRIACFITANKPKADSFLKKVVPLILRSSVKYKEYALFWDKDSV